MSLEEARCAVVNAARALRQSGMMDVRLDALYGALDALDAVGDAPIPTTTMYWCAHPECWRQNDTAGIYCYQHSRVAALPSLRRRDAAFEVQDE